MSRIKKILVAVDFSAYSLNIGRYAGRMAEDLNANLLWVNVINRRDVSAVKQVLAHTSQNLPVADCLSMLKRERVEKMQTLIRKAGCINITHRVIVRTGIPHQELITAALEEQVDIVIMGAKGRSELAGIIFGSTAEKMFRRCPVPLLSLREKDDQNDDMTHLRPLYLYKPDYQEKPTG
jgi:nucleotide-binding universal stress UspA family protein